MENRSSLNFTGIEDCKSFDENAIVLSTEMGELTIKGENLKIESFNNESKEMVLSGKVFALIYTNENTRTGFFSKIFK